MKKLLLTILFIFTLVGCTKKEELKNTYDIELDSNPSTGYTWSYSISEEGIIKFIKDEFISPNNSEDLVGAPGIQKYQIAGVKEGEVEITFTYRRQWETESSDDIGYIYKFKIDKDLNIELINKEDLIRE